MSETIFPFTDGVLVKPHNKESKSSGGIIIPESVQENAQRGEVIAVGPDATTKVGDTVAYGKHSGVKFTEDLLMFKEPNLLAIIKTKK